jgi:hypothetical protein
MLKRVSRFTDDRALNERLVEFESNTERAVEALERERARRLSVRLVTKDGSVVRPGECIVVDGATDITLLLAQPAAGDEGSELEVIKRRTGGFLVLRPIDSRLDGAASATLSLVGRHSLRVAGGDYWR